MKERKSTTSTITCIKDVLKQLRSLYTPFNIIPQIRTNERICLFLLKLGVGIQIVQQPKNISERNITLAVYRPASYGAGELA